MHHDVIMAGFGGQGVLLIGKLLAYAGMTEGREVSWFPSYGPEMRGGTANCMVVISDKPVGSPVIKHPSGVIAMNLPSLDRFESVLKTHGFLLVNSSLVNRDPLRTDIDFLKVPANQIALELGVPKAANMVALGAFVGRTGIVDPENILAKIRDEFRGKDKIIEANLKTFDRGYSLGAGKA